MRSRAAFSAFTVFFYLFFYYYFIFNWLTRPCEIILGASGGQPSAEVATLEEEGPEVYAVLSADTVVLFRQIVCRKCILIVALFKFAFPLTN